MENKFETIRKFLLQGPLAHCVIYSVASAYPEIKVSKLKALSSVINSSEEFDRIASTYQDIAINCYRQNRDLVLEENLLLSDSSDLICELLPPGSKIENPPQANSDGQRWWHLAVGSGAMRNAGMVVVARVGARGEKEVWECVKGLQSIMAHELPSE